ncbi:MAG: hypothetical protein ACYCQK_05070 [Acidiferrobacteraceae bacterium]
MAIVSKARLSVHLKTRWKKKGPRTVEDMAGVVGFNVWRIAQETFRHMEADAFRFGSDAQVAAVMTELIAFLVQSTDRMVHGKLTDLDRSAFINALAMHLAKTMENNQTDLCGPGDYRKIFIDTLNARSADYAEYSYGADGPSYRYLRYLGECVAAALADTGNQWVVEHMMELEAPDMLKYLKKLVADVVLIQTPQ